MDVYWGYLLSAITSISLSILPLSIRESEGNESIRCADIYCLGVTLNLYELFVNVKRKIRVISYK